MKKTELNSDPETRERLQDSSFGGESRQTREKASRFAVLGMLSLGRKSGYDIKKAIANSTSNFWSESYGNIYPVLKKLLAEGAIRAMKDGTPANGRQKQLYSITADGKRMLEEWLRQPVARRIEDNEMLLKLFFSAAVSPKEPRALVNSYREYHAGLLAKYEGIEEFISMQQATKEQKIYWLATLRHGKVISRALLDWCDATERELQSLKP
jgi:PadR family transcriptional regulator, regulatory protein AphA